MGDTRKDGDFEYAYVDDDKREPPKSGYDSLMLTLVMIGVAIVFVLVWTATH